MWLGLGFRVRVTLKYFRVNFIGKPQGRKDERSSHQTQRSAGF